MKLLLATLIAAAPLCAQTYVIKNATVMTVSKGTFKGSILVKDGKIAELGENIVIRRFTRYMVGEDSASDSAAE